MGLIKLLGTPVTGTLYAGRKLLDVLADQAEQQYYDEAAILEELSALEAAHRLGHLDADEFELREARLLKRWSDARAYHAQRQEGG